METLSAKGQRLATWQATNTRYLSAISSQLGQIFADLPSTNVRQVSPRKLPVLLQRRTLLDAPAQ